MTGEEHYTEAERDINTANDSPISDSTAAFFMARAQVHATLALAAVANGIEQHLRPAMWLEPTTPPREDR